MKTNKEVAALFNELAAIEEYNGTTKFKTAAYKKAAQLIRSYAKPVMELRAEDWDTIPGVGQGIIEKLGEIQDSGTIHALEDAKAKLPEGFSELFRIKGLGPGKLRALHDELGIQNIDDLKAAIADDRLAEVKGFGAASQTKISKHIHFMEAVKDYFLYADFDQEQTFFEELIEAHYDGPMLVVGEFARQMPVMQRVEYLVEKDIQKIKAQDDLQILTNTDTSVELLYKGKFQVKFHIAERAQWGNMALVLNGPDEFTENFPVVSHLYASEAILFEAQDLPYIPPYLRDLTAARLKQIKLDQIVQKEDIRGLIHTHSLASDGQNSIIEMAVAAQANGLDYMLMTDHSQAAFYANGLDEDRIYQQKLEIEILNKELQDFIIYRGIECDILNDGSLDLPQDVLADLDVVIVSIHSNLDMKIEQATDRLIKAIEHPETDILGHMTGRLLLQRPGYPLHIQKVLDACAANEVAIELNANPKRLDIDWQYIPLALDRGIKICINPDAHHKDHIGFIKYGVAVAQKAGLQTSDCLNCLSAADFLRSFKA